MRSLLLPRTDTAVLVEAATSAVVCGTVITLVWHDPEWRLFAVGVTVCVFAFFAFRALH